ncbi:MAG: hypothetical protein ACRD3F_00510, partial [Acidobacteriaceae bacterium]
MALKTGFEDKKKVILAVILGVVVLFLVLRVVFSVMGGSTPPPRELPPTVAQTPASAGAQHQAVKVSDSSMMHLDPTLHPEWMAAAESLKYRGSGRNIFSMSSTPVAIEKPIGPVRPNAHPAVAQGPPPPPAIDLKFFGFEAHSGGSRKAFLLHGDDVFIAAT